MDAAPCRNLERDDVHPHSCTMLRMLGSTLRASTRSSLWLSSLSRAAVVSSASLLNLNVLGMQRLAEPLRNVKGAPP